ncbi:MAG: bifunctional alpha,alpha-trehalose-phosphate synthase (UDP-forming)/trehalose-phosphatase [Chloroflexota bacterium]|nr:bifunctional alpha,alpha-trehalose-phosphate synthase (UDP-forming)/trehalose-phosphatase [Chloroflexota bacterium]
MPYPSEVPPATGRLLLVANRLPITARIGDDGAISVEPSSGGLATGLWGPHQRSGGLWIGWPGELQLDPRQKRQLDDKLADLRALPVYLTQDEVNEYYENMANGVLWPLFHYLIDQLPNELGDWNVFRGVNEKFARAVIDNYRSGDLIWVQDYHLMLVPAMLRRALPDARIGFFLHVPFPSSEVFSVLPWREEILQGLLGADLIGFHTPGYLRHFSTSLRRVLGVDVDVDALWQDERRVRLGVFPMGVDAARWARSADSPEVAREVASLCEEAGGRKIIVGIDRLDYTKGIPRRLVAIDRLFADHPELCDRVRVVQVTVPSREHVEQYAEFKRRIDELVGRINGTHATASWMPIHHMYRAISQAEVCALYRAADVMLVTPVRDGMNLVAKEFVATRTDEDGVLILSEFAGAAAEMGEALHINPFDTERLAARINDALSMPEPERKARMRALRSRVLTHDVHRWAESFIGALAETGPAYRRSQRASAPSDLASIVECVRRAPQALLVLDYDGTLVPFAPTPDEAVPDPDLRDLLSALAARPGLHVHVVSGRTRASLDRWLGCLPVGLHAEHGLWSRLAPGAPWRILRPVSQEWKEKVRPIMEHFVGATRGTFIEEKTGSLAWHYRLAKADFAPETDFGEYQAKELRLLLGEMLSNAPVQVLAGNKVVEVRPQGVHKGMIVPVLLSTIEDQAPILVVGDDRTDEDIFAALPDDALTVHVGSGVSLAQFRVDTPADVRRLLRAIVA